MTALVADASALAALLFGEAEAAGVADRIRGCELHAPELLAFEIANTAVKKVRRNDLDAATAADALTHLARLDVHWHRVPPERLLPLALATELTAYDAAYLWLSRALHVPIVTLDRRLEDAWKR